MAQSRAMAIRVAHITTVDQSLVFLLLNQMQSLRAVGYDVCAISSPGPYLRSLSNDGIKHFSISMNRGFSPLRDLNSLWLLYRTFRREKFDVVHTHTPKAGLLAQLAATAAGVPVIVNTIHGFYFHEHMTWLGRFFFVALEKVAALCSDLILSQNQEDIETALAKGICKPPKIRYLGNGVDIGHFDKCRLNREETAGKRAELSIPEGAPVVGFVGRLAAKRKGFTDFLATCEVVAKQRPDVKFLIVGETDHGKSDAVGPDLASKYGIADKCVFTGWRPVEELPTLFTLMNVLVLPSLFEGIPRVVMEASAMSVPAVVTKVRGNRETVSHDENGLLVPLGDVAALSNAVLELISNPEKARRMGRAGRERAVRCFDERLVFERVRTEYANLLRRKGFTAPRTDDDDCLNLG